MSADEILTAIEAGRVNMFRITHNIRTDKKWQWYAKVSKESSAWKDAESFHDCVVALLAEK